MAEFKDDLAPLVVETIRYSKPTCLAKAYLHDSAGWSTTHAGHRLEGISALLLKAVNGGGGFGHVLALQGTLLDICLVRSGVVFISLRKHTSAGIPRSIPPPRVVAEDSGLGGGVARAAVAKRATAMNFMFAVLVCLLGLILNVDVL